jgi:hypothetical protein
MTKAAAIKRINQRLEMYNLFLRAARRMLEEKKKDK